MSASWELQTLSAIIKNGDYKITIDHGITAKDFHTVEGRMIFGFLSTYYNQADHYGEVASEQLVRENFPKIDLLAPQQTLAALCVKLKEDSLRLQLKAVLSEAEERVDSDPKKAFAILTEKINTLVEVQDTGDVFFEKDAFDSLASLYEAGEGAGGLPWPWPELTKIAGPIEPGTLNVVYGIPKSQKTWVALYAAAHLRLTTNARALIYSREMSTIRLMKRIACLLAQVSYERFQDKALTPEEQERLFSILGALREESENPKEHAAIIFTKGMSNTELAIQILKRKIEVYKPDIIVLDSAYHLAGDADWRTIAKLTSQLKGVAEDTGVPIIAVTQENERKAYEYSGTRGTASMAQSPSWAMDADLLIRCILKGEVLNLLVGANREKKVSTHKGIRINGCPANDYSFIDYNVEDYSSPQASSKQEAELDASPEVEIPAFNPLSAFKRSTTRM
jgi:replicative DNA helicase